jgi:hypothetical protein
MRRAGERFFRVLAFKGFALEEEAKAWLSDELDHIADRARSNRVGHATRREEAQALERQAQQRRVAARAEERSRDISGSGAGGGDRGASGIGWDDSGPDSSSGED